MVAPLRYASNGPMVSSSSPAAFVTFTVRLTLNPAPS